MENWLPLVSLIFLVVAIAAGFITKINTGFIAVGLALILGRMSGISDGEIVRGFNYSLFFTLTGVTFLFSIAQHNGTLELFATKVVALFSKRAYLIPIVIYLLAVVLSAIGPGTIPVTALIAPIAISLAIQMRVEPIRLAPFGILGACAGGFSHIAPTGIIGITVAADNGITGLKYSLVLGLVVGMGLYALMLYFAFKCYNMKTALPMRPSDLPSFSRNQWITLAGILVMTLLILLFKVNVGLAAFIVSMVLLLLRVADEQKSLAGIPLGTLWLVTGVGVLMNLVLELGGIDLLAGLLAKLMTRTTAAPIISLTSGILSWFSSTSGVVLPTIIPTVPNIAQQVSGVNMAEMVIAISTGSHAAALSPLSTLGALAIAAYTTMTDTDARKRNKLFGQMFIVSIIGVLLMAVLSWTGLFGLIARSVPIT